MALETRETTYVEYKCSPQKRKIEFESGPTEEEIKKMGDDEVIQYVQDAQGQLIDLGFELEACINSISNGNCGVPLKVSMCSRMVGKSTPWTFMRIRGTTS
ncbi:MAG: hypothetical protein GOV00_02620 [Candidatus Altiarchaeota archaeon]|nr:hypothetical protein [Candidatus Altiarchaeota archaeon]